MKTSKTLHLNGFWAATLGQEFDSSAPIEWQMGWRDFYIKLWEQRRV